MKNSAFEKDLFRYYGENKESFRQRLVRPRELAYISLIRKLQANPNPVLKLFYKLRYKRLRRITQIQIPYNTSIGEGFYIGHCGRIIINPSARLGKNVNIGTGVTIGQENRGKRKGYPVIGDSCFIGTNSVIVGNVTIGNDVLIAPLTYVNFDVPDHSIVIGNPGKIIPRDDATAGYVNRTV